MSAGASSAKGERSTSSSPVRCTRCYRSCLLRGGPGFCTVVGPGGDLYPWRAVYMSVMPAEEVPVYHVCPGGTALRLVVPGAVYRCDVCWWRDYSDARALVLRRISANLVAAKARSVNADLVLVDGCEPLVQDWIFELLRQLRAEGLRVGFKSCGLVSRERLVRAADIAELIVFELPHPGVAGVSAVPEFFRALEAAASTSAVIEVHVLFNGDRTVSSIASELAAKFGDRIAIHVIPVGEDVSDAGYRLAERVRRTGKRGTQAYLYGDTSFTLTDTLCPSCGKPLVRRHAFGTRVLARPSSEGDGVVCPHCGTRYRWLRLCKGGRKGRALHREVVVW